MAQRGPSGVQNARGPLYVFWPYAACPSKPALRKVAKHRRTRFPVTKTFTILAACLGALFISYIVLEALDGDLDLWPLGAENFTAASHADFVIASQPFSTFFALNPILWFVVTAGAHLVMRHRARSALPTDTPSILIAVTMAEPWGQSVNPALALGHLFFRRICP
jgi:hypothetical protein